MMTKKLLIASIALALSATTGPAHAQGNSAAGKTKAAACAGCHGENGNSLMGQFPKLAGQHETYLSKQLQAFKDGSRVSPMMAPLVVSLDNEAIADLAAYYAANKISANDRAALPVDNDDEDDSDAPQKSEQAKKAELNKVLLQGSDLYRNGDLSREVSACIACHGPYAEGNKPAGFPSLHSQHAEYVIKALTDFKSGARSNNPENMMHMIAKKMTDQEIKAVAYYISTMK